MIETIIREANKEDVINLLLAGACCDSLYEAADQLGEDGQIVGLAFDVIALLRAQDDYEEDETDEDYYIEAMLEAAQRLIEGRIKLP